MTQLKISFEPIDRNFLDFSRSWLEDQEFRSLIMAEPVERASQEAWFNSLPHKADYRIWGLKSSTWVGACGLKNIDKIQQTAEYWGYIYPTSLRGQGLGYKMFKFSSSQAVEINVKRLWLRVNERNKPALLAYKKWGFMPVNNTEPGVMHMEITL